jgi:hypothetical protein
MEARYSGFDFIFTLFHWNWVSRSKMNHNLILVFLNEMLFLEMNSPWNPLNTYESQLIKNDDRVRYQMI